MAMLGSVKYRFSLKTPIHVGSGEQLGRIDFVLDKNRCAVIDIESLLEKIGDNRDALNEFAGEGFNMHAFLRKYRISPFQVEKYTLRNPDGLKGGIGNIREIIKTGMGNPFIPGSSIKGSIRTVFFHYLLNSADKKVVSRLLNRIIKSDISKEQADGEIDHDVFGKDPSHDLLRAIQVGDVEFGISDLCLKEVRVLNLTGKGGYGWKKMGKNGFTTPDQKKATPIFLETLGEGRKSTGRIRIDGFLLENAMCISELGFSGKTEILKDLPGKCNDFAREFINSEIEFFNNCGMKKMEEFYNNLLNEIPDDNKTFFLHLGWGSGWRGMTGGWSDEELIRIRKRFNLGKSICPKCGEKTKLDKKIEGFSYCFSCKESLPTSMTGTFPKTRKIAFRGGAPKYALGWIKVEKIEEDSISKQSIGISRPEVTKPDPQSEFMNKFEKFRLRPSPESYRGFITKIKKEDIPDLKEISFRPLKGIMNIGFVTVLIECDLHDDIRKILASMMLDVIKKGKKWSTEKLQKYRQMEDIAKQI